MKKISLTFCLFLSVLIGFNFSGNAQSLEGQIKTLDSVYSKLYERGMFNGVILYAESGVPVYKKSFGVANIETNEQLSLSSPFNLASVSKQFIGMMVMILKERGKLSYDDKVQKFIPSFPYNNITVRHLLNHVSGLPEYFDLAKKYTNPIDTLTNDGVLQLLSTYHPALAFQPGERFEYCNTGYIVLASIIKMVSGVKVEDFLHNEIVLPLGLKNTYAYYYKSNIPEPSKRVLGFERMDGKNVTNDLIRIDGVIGDGNIYSSAEDLLRWEQALYTEKLVKKETLQEAFTPAKLNNSTESPYGFGWGIRKSNEIYQHTGGWVGFRNLIYRDVQKKRTLILLSNNSLQYLGFATKILDNEHVEVPETQLIKNVNVIDGTGALAKKADVRILKDRIYEIGNLTPIADEKQTDGEGQFLAPGFIDSHSHHANGISQHPEAIAPISQGITTIVSGQDGTGYPIDSIIAWYKRTPIALNIATYTGHEDLRTSAMGENNTSRISTPSELAQMKATLKSEMSKGSLGLSTGLEYEVGFYANRDEVIELTKTVADSGGRYISHILSEDVRLDEALDQIIEIGKLTKVPVQISHIKIALKDRWGESNKILELLENARREGINITADCYPYTYWHATLRVLFPKKDFKNIESAKYAVEHLIDPTKSYMSEFSPLPMYERKTLTEIAAIRKEKVEQTLLWMIDEAERTKGDEGVMGTSMDETDVINFLNWENTNLCSDGANSGHPRGYGAFTRFLGHYVRDLKIMPLEMAIHKMTGLTAEHLGLKNRGFIAPGAFADIVLFDPKTVGDNATIKDNKALSSGILKVWVNGQLVFKNKKSENTFPGVFIKRD